MGVAQLLAAWRVVSFSVRGGALRAELSRGPSEPLLREALPGVWHDWDRLVIELCRVGLGTFEGTRGKTR